ncbi:hypothetical protein Trydic_g23738 [Trypoxylus dichotomus]
MSSRSEKDKTKQLQDKCQAVLTELLRDEDNKYCVDCDSKGPRWASWNLGVFLCIRCAGIHRNLGVHISKVKSVNLDAWTPEQVVSLQQMGNSRARAVYEANLPDNFRRPQNDSNLETFIRAKYEHKKYIAREWVPPPLPKVNWEKEIEEEIEKQKRKKKTVVEKKNLGNVEVPQLPKPKNPSPKPGRASSSSTTSTANSTQATPVADNKQTTDLLGLQNGEDGFSNFLSAPSIKEEKNEENKTIDNSKSEEESFFNQTAPTEKEKAKLTKDSILALYGNAPAITNFNPAYPTQAAHVPYAGGFPQQNYQNFSYQQNYQKQNGIQQQFPPQNVYPNQFPVQSVNQFGGTIPVQSIQMPPGQAITSQFQYVTQTQFQQTAQFQSLPSQFVPVNQYQPNVANPPSVPNPFFANQANLQQQFSALSLNSQTTGNAAPTLATNIWQ